MYFAFFYEEVLTRKILLKCMFNRNTNLTVLSRGNFGGP